MIEYLDSIKSASLFTFFFTKSKLFFFRKALEKTCLDRVLGKIRLVSLPFIVATWDAPYGSLQSYSYGHLLANSKSLGYLVPRWHWCFTYFKFPLKKNVNISLKINFRYRNIILFNAYFKILIPILPEKKFTWPT